MIVSRSEIYLQSHNSTGQYTQCSCFSTQEHILGRSRWIQRRQRKKKTKRNNSFRNLLYLWHNPQMGKRQVLAGRTERIQTSKIQRSAVHVNRHLMGSLISLAGELLSLNSFLEPQSDDQFIPSYPLFLFPSFEFSVILNWLAGRARTNY